MFVRTKKGKILKCFKSESMNLPNYYVIGSKTNSYIEYQDVKKTSEDIIDILEVGDYVNGHRVDKVVIGPKCSYVLLEEVGCYVDSQEDIADYEIKSIVTKEQFSQMQYKVD